MLRESDRLKEYRAKRDFSRTPEPAPKRKKKSKGKLRYLIQKHAARREHYDFRLEHNGALLSWAVPRGPSLDTKEKRLAVRTEDHPLEYGNFEGTIPEGEYGGGTVMLWDQGTWEPRLDVDQGLRDGQLKLNLHGKRLQGGWALVRLRARKGDRGKQNWLLIKERDDFVRVEKRPLVEREKTSVKSGRTMEEIARGKKVWHSNRPTKKSRFEEAAPKPARRKGKGLKLPPFVEPQLATYVEGPPPGADWVHEIKYDGYRAVASVADGKVVIRTRKGLDWTDRFRHARTRARRSSLRRGAARWRDRRRRRERAYRFRRAAERALRRARRLQLLSFRPAAPRRRGFAQASAARAQGTLRKLLDKASRRGPLLFSDHVEGEGERVFERARALKLEGIISKQADAPYRSGRTRSWLKSKVGDEQELVIIGWRPSDKPRRPFSSLLLAVNEDGKLRYAGRVGTGFSDQRLDDLGREVREACAEDAARAGRAAGDCAARALRRAGARRRDRVSRLDQGRSGSSGGIQRTACRQAGARDRPGEAHAKSKSDEGRKK